MIRFSAFLVVVAVGTLVGGVVTSKLLLVYIAIGVSGLALLALGIGAAVNWRELTGKPETAEAQASTAHPDAAPASTVQAAGAAQAASAPQPVPSRAVTPEPAQAPATSAVTGTTASRAPWSPPVPAGSSRAGYLPTEPPPSTGPAAPSPWARRDAPPPGQPPAREPAASPASIRGESPAADDDVSIQDQTLIFRAQDPAPADREDDATSASEPEPAASASEPAPAPEAEPEPEPDAAAADTTDDATTPPGPAAPDPDPASDVTVVPGVPRYHKSQCILIRFMGDSDLDKMTVADARAAGCTPCRACLPGQSDSPAE